MYLSALPPIVAFPGGPPSMPANGGVPEVLTDYGVAPYNVEPQDFGNEAPIPGIVSYVPSPVSFPAGSPGVYAPTILSGARGIDFSSPYIWGGVALVVLGLVLLSGSRD